MPFSSNTFIERRKVLKQKLKSGVVLFLGNEMLGMNYRDNTYHFRQESCFLYYFGLDKPNLIGLIDIDNDQEVIFGEEITLNDIVWEGPQPSLQELASQVGISSVKSLSEAKKHLSRNTLFLPPYRSEQATKLSDLLGLSIQEIQTTRQNLALIEAIVSQRIYKNAEEVAEMERAVDISGEMHLAAMRHTQANMTEYEVVAHIEYTVRKWGANLAYPIIFSQNGQTLHNHYHGNTLSAGRLALGDFGAEVASHYAGDITRTFPVSARFTQQQKDVYNIVLRCLEETNRTLRPNRLYLDYHLKAWEIMAEGLVDLGILRGNSTEMATAGVCGLFMPHGLGHQIGLDVHDMENLGEDHIGYRAGLDRSKMLGLRSLRMARELEASMVITVEPGIYFIPQLIDQWQAAGHFKEYINYEKLATYRDFGGIRIEDNCLITEDSARVLGKPIPKTVEEVEDIRSMSF